MTQQKVLGHSVCCCWTEKIFTWFSEPLLQPTCKTLRIPLHDESTNKAGGSSYVFPAQDVKCSGRRYWQRCICRLQPGLWCLYNATGLWVVGLFAPSRMNPLLMNPAPLIAHSEPQWPWDHIWKRPCCFISACQCRPLSPSTRLLHRVSAEWHNYTSTSKLSCSFSWRVSTSSCWSKKQQCCCMLYFSMEYEDKEHKGSDARKARSAV